MALNYVCHLSQWMMGGLGKFWLNKGGGDGEKAAKIMNNEIVEHFSSGCSLQCDVPLTKFLVGWDTKDFLVNHGRINSWEELSEEGKKCFMDCPKTSLPDWDDTVEGQWWMFMALRFFGQNLFWYFSEWVFPMQWMKMTLTNACVSTSSCLN